MNTLDFLLGILTGIYFSAAVYNCWIHWKKEERAYLSFKRKHDEHEADRAVARLRNELNV
jgi:hypothetical protein